MVMLVMFVAAVVVVVVAFFTMARVSMLMNIKKGKINNVIV